MAEGLSVLLSSAVEKGLYEPLEVGEDRVKVSHLQFADNTIFLGKATIENIHFLRRFLGLVEFVAGLKVNKNKSSLYGINTEGREEDFASRLGYRIGSMPFKYLGVNVGSMHRRVSEWEYVIQKVKNRLSKWGGGRRFLLVGVLLW